MADIQFEDNSIEVKAAMDAIILAWLYEAGGELTSQVQRNTPVDTGQLKGSWGYKVDETAQKAIVGSPLENAIWNEFGTGQYALHGNGRKTPWHWKDVKGNWHTTTGKRPQRSFHFAYEKMKTKLPKALEKKLKEGMK